MPREAHNMMQSFFHRVQIIAKPHQANRNSTPSDCLECQEIIFGVLLLATGLERKERERRVAENTIYLIWLSGVHADPTIAVCGFWKLLSEWRNARCSHDSGINLTTQFHKVNMTRREEGPVWQHRSLEEALGLSHFVHHFTSHSCSLLILLRLRKGPVKIATGFVDLLLQVLWKTRLSRGQKAFLNSDFVPNLPHSTCVAP